MALAQQSRGDTDRLANVTRESKVSFANSARSTSTGSLQGEVSERLHVLKQRVSVLEDAFAKSELDRNMVYEENQKLKQETQRMMEDRASLLHALHDMDEQRQSMQPALDAADRKAMSDRIDALEQDKQASGVRIDELETTIKRLNRERARILRESDGVSVADLHYSNERLSAQLTKLHQLQSRVTSADDNKVASCESAIFAMSSDVQALEQRLTLMQQQHFAEKQALQHQLDKQFQEFSVERVECEKLVGILGAKLEASLSEGVLLRNQNALLLQQQQFQQQAITMNTKAASSPPVARRALYHR